jgi:hypothetical protein
LEQIGVEALFMARFSPALLGCPPTATVAATGRFALSIRRLGRTNSNGVVEKHVGAAATTRNWNTIEAIREVLQS